MKIKIDNIDTNTKGKITIEFLGCGGAFDVNQGNSSAVLTAPGGEKLLIDCGSLVFKELINRELVKDIENVFITHTHDDHIGSLSALIYLNWFVLKRALNLYCSEEVSKKLKVFLEEVSGHEEEQFKLIPIKIGKEFTPIKEVKATLVDVTKFHVSKLPNAGVVFEVDACYLVYSSDTNKFTMDTIQESNKPLYEKLQDQKENLVILHDASKYFLPGNSVHIFYKDLAERAKDYKNMFVYHHSKDDAEFIKASGFEFPSIAELNNKKITIEQ